MIIKVVFRSVDSDTHEASAVKMLFGNSYKNWKIQYEEFIRLNRNLVPISAFKSSADWIGWGGLKWCPEEEFQDALNREGCQHNEPDNPNPRQYASMIFQVLPIEKLPKV